MPITNYIRFNSGLNITASKLNELQELLASNIYNHQHNDDQAPRIWADFIRLNSDALNYGTIQSVLDHVRSTALHNSTSESSTSFNTQNRMAFQYIAAGDFEWKDYFWEADISLPDNLYNDNEYMVYFQPVYPFDFTQFYSDLNPGANFSSLEGVVPLNNSMLDFNVYAHSLKSDGFKVRMQHIGMGDRYNIIGRSERAFMGSEWVGRKFYDGTFLYPAQIQALDDRLYVASKGNHKISILSTINGSMIDVIDPPKDFLGNEFRVLDIGGFSASVYKVRGVVRYAVLVTYNVVNTSNEVHQCVYLFDGDRSGLVKLTKSDSGYDGSYIGINTYYAQIPLYNSSRLSTSCGPHLDGNSAIKILRVAGNSSLSANSLVDTEATENCQTATWDAPLLIPDVTGEIAEGAAVQYERSSYYTDISQVNKILRVQRNKAVLIPSDPTSATSMTALKQWVINNLSKSGSIGTPSAVAPDNSFVTPWGTTFGMTTNRSNMVTGVPYIDLVKSKVGTVSSIPMESQSFSQLDQSNLYGKFSTATPDQIVDHLNWQEATGSSDNNTLNSTNLPSVSDGEAIIDPVIVVKGANGQYYEFRPNESAKYLENVSKNNGFSYWNVVSVENKSEVARVQSFSYNSYINYQVGEAEVKTLLESMSSGANISYIFTGVGQQNGPTTSYSLNSSGDVSQWVPNSQPINLPSMSANTVRNYRSILDGETVGNLAGGFTHLLYASVVNGLDIDWQWVEGQGSAIALIDSKWRYYASSKEKLNSVSGGEAVCDYRQIASGTGSVSLSGTKLLVDSGGLNFVTSGVRVGDLVEHGTTGEIRRVSYFSNDGAGGAYGTGLWVDDDGTTFANHGYTIWRGVADTIPVSANNLYDWYNITDNIDPYIQPVSVDGVTVSGVNTNYTVDTGGSVPLTNPKLDFILCKNAPSFDKILLTFVDGEYFDVNMSSIFKRSTSDESLDVCGIFDKFDKAELVDISVGIGKYNDEDYLVMYLSDQLNHVVHVYRTKNSFADATPVNDIDLSVLLSTWVQDSDTSFLGILRGQQASDGLHARYYGDKYALNPDVIIDPELINNEDYYPFWKNAYDSDFWFAKQRLNAWEGDMSRAARYNIIGDALIENNDYRNGIASDSKSPINKMGFLIFTKPLTYESRTTIGDTFAVDPRYVEEIYMNHPDNVDYADVEDITEYTCYTGKIINNAYTLMNSESKANSYTNSFVLLNNPDINTVDFYLDFGQSLWLPTYFTDTTSDGLGGMVIRANDFVVRYCNGASRYIVPDKRADTAGWCLDKSPVDESNLDARILHRVHATSFDWGTPASALVKYDNMLNFASANRFSQWNPTNEVNINVENFRLGVAVPVGSTYDDLLPLETVDTEVKSGLNWIVFGYDGKAFGDDTEKVWFSLDWDYVDTDLEVTDSSTMIRIRLTLSNDFRELISSCSDLNGLPPGCSIPYTPSYRFSAQLDQSVLPVVNFLDDLHYDSIDDPAIGALGAFSDDGTVYAPGGINNSDAKYLNTVKVMNHPQVRGGLWISMFSPPLRWFPRYIHPYVFRNNQIFAPFVGEWASSYFTAESLNDLIGAESQLSSSVSIAINDFRYYKILRHVAARTL